MSSNKFLERFEGKIQIVGKEGVQNVFAGQHDNVVVYTHSNFNPGPHKTSSSLSRPRPAPNDSKPARSSLQKGPSQDPPPKHQTPKPEKESGERGEKKAKVEEKRQRGEKKQKFEKKEKLQKKEKSDNPFLVSNPFYLEQEERQKLEQERRQREAQDRELQRQMQAQQAKRTGGLGRSAEKRRGTQKEWVRLGGLGANIGGEDWVEKKKKQDKMQEFSSLVKQINREKPKLPRPPPPADRVDNPRTKALEYSKNVPRPAARVVAERLPEAEQPRESEVELSELQQYELRHQQLKSLLREQL